MAFFRSIVPTLAVMALLTACGGTPTDTGNRVILTNPSFPCEHSRCVRCAEDRDGIRNRRRVVIGERSHVRSPLEAISAAPVSMAVTMLW